MDEERSWRAMREHWKKYEKGQVHSSKDFRKKSLFQKAREFLRGLLGR